MSDMTAREAMKVFHDMNQKQFKGMKIHSGLNFLSYDDTTKAMYFHLLDRNYSLIFAVYGDTFDELLDAFNAKWAEYSDTHDKRQIREMALQIIRLTAELGECTDAALRATKFSEDDVERYGARAIADANEIAERGPFHIVAIGGANGAPDFRADIAAAQEGRS